jgi:hypothetical protein
MPLGPRQPAARRQRTKNFPPCVFRRVWGPAAAGGEPPSAGLRIFHNGSRQRLQISFRRPGVAHPFRPGMAAESPLVPGTAWPQRHLFCRSSFTLPRQRSGWRRRCLRVCESAFRLSQEMQFRRRAPARSNVSGVCCRNASAKVPVRTGFLATVAKMSIEQSI